MFLPQMSPMLWMYLSMFFVMTMIISNNMMYFNYSMLMKKKLSMIKKSMNWMW